MKKNIFYIFILVMMWGVLLPVAQAQPQPIGTCRVSATGTSPSSAEQKNVTKAYCQGVLDGISTTGYTATWTENNTTTTITLTKTPPPPTTGQQTLLPYTLLAPFHGVTNVPVDGASALGNYLNIIIKIAIGLAAVLAMVMIVMGGIQYMTSELAHSKESGKNKITNAILGLLVALGAWLILSTINPDLLDTNVAITKTTIQFEDVPQEPVNGAYVNYIPGNPNIPIGADWVAIAGAPYVLQNGATTDRPGNNCSTVGEINCTSLRGLRPDYILTIQANCPNCQIVVTGGTEFWRHRVGTTHRPGSPTIDLRLTPSLTQYIMGGTTPPVNGKRYVRNGTSFLFEGNHWHAGF